MNTKVLLPQLLCFLILANVGNICAQGISINARIGYSEIPDQAEQRVFWNSTLSFGGNAFYTVVPDFQIGVQVASNKWTIDKEQVNRSRGLYDDSDYGLSGYRKVTEILSTVRLSQASSGNVKFFIQFGYGLFKFEGSLVSDDFSLKETINEDGVSFGGGFTIGILKNLGFEILPIYQVMFINGREDFNYFSLNVGVALYDQEE